MLRLLPILLMITYGVLMWQFSQRRSMRMLDENSTPLSDPSILRLTDKLAEALDLDAIKVHVLEVDAINGLAAADGRIFLTRGFLNRKMRGEVSADELASVIAHELGHVALGHSRRRMIDFTGQNAVFVMLSALLNRFLPFIGIWIAKMISSALMARMSRRDEFEADAYASALLLKAGLGTSAQKTLLAKLGVLAQTTGAGIPAWLMSHPEASQRIRAIESNEARWLA